MRDFTWACEAPVYACTTLSQDRYLHFVLAPRFTLFLIRVNGSEIASCVPKSHANGCIASFSSHALPYL